MTRFEKILAAYDGLRYFNTAENRIFFRDVLHEIRNDSSRMILVNIENGRVVWLRRNKKWVNFPRLDTDTKDVVRRIIDMYEGHFVEDGVYLLSTIPIGELQ